MREVCRAPRYTVWELAGLRSRLLIYDDTAPILKEALEGVPCRVEMPYSDSIEARGGAGGTVSRVRDLST